MRYFVLKTLQINIPTFLIRLLSGFYGKGWIRRKLLHTNVRFQEDVPVYDLLNCEKGNRFAVNDNVIAHNCLYGVGVKSLYENLRLEGVDISLDQTKDLHAGYWRIYEGIKKHQWWLKDQWAENNGYIVNGIGRPVAVAEDKLHDITNRCLSGNTIVYTNNGLKRIIDVSSQDKVWDGECWVRHEGLIHQGVKDTITFKGVYMTPDHKVLTTNEGMMEVEDVIKNNHDTYKALLPNTMRTYHCNIRFNSSREAKTEEVYDLRNCGPLHRFTILTEDGPLIVSNCGQSSGHDIQLYLVDITNFLFLEHGIRFQWVIADWHDQLIVSVHKDDAELAYKLIKEDSYQILNEEVLQGEIPIKGDPNFVDTIADAKVDPITPDNIECPACEGKMDPLKNKLTRREWCWYYCEKCDFEVNRNLRKYK